MGHFATSLINCSCQGSLPLYGTFYWKWNIFDIALNFNSYFILTYYLWFSKPFLMIVYKNTDEWYIEWQRVTTNNNEWYNEWERMTASDTASDNKWQQIAMRESEWQQWYNERKRHSTLQRMDHCHPFNDKNRYTTTSSDGWLQLEWLDK